MAWNPFDRRSAQQRAVDDTLVGLDKSDDALKTRLVRVALAAWRARVGSPDDAGKAVSRRLDLVRQRIGSADSEAYRVIGVTDLAELRKSLCGRVTHAAVVLASAIETLDAWSAAEVAHRIVRIHLDDEVAAVARSAGLLQAAYDRLGTPPGHLADDEEVMRVYRSRKGALHGRETMLIDRLASLRKYYDGLALAQRELEKTRWIREHNETDFANIEAQEQDELGSMTLDAVGDMFDQATAPGMARVRDAAQQLQVEP